jgi:hypothetical protein
MTPIHYPMNKIRGEEVTASGRGEHLRGLRSVERRKAGTLLPRAKSITVERAPGPLDAAGGATPHSRRGGLVTFDDTGKGAECAIVPALNPSNPRLPHEFVFCSHGP